MRAEKIKKNGEKKERWKTGIRKLQTKQQQQQKNEENDKVYDIIFYFKFDLISIALLPGLWSDSHLSHSISILFIHFVFFVILFYYFASC